MATETLYPDALITATGFTSPNVSQINGVEDGTWMLSNGDDNQELRVSFPTPSGNPTTGTGVQSFRAYLKKSATGGGDPTYTAELYETGGSTALQTLASGVAVTSATGVAVTLSWNAANLATANGSAVELRLTFVKGGGGPNERNMDVDSVRWNVDYSAAASPISGTAALAVSANGVLGGWGALAAAPEIDLAHAAALVGVGVLTGAGSVTIAVSGALESPGPTVAVLLHTLRMRRYA